jgi:hypothetical protein
MPKSININSVPCVSTSHIQPSSKMQNLLSNIIEKYAFAPNKRLKQIVQNEYNSVYSPHRFNKNFVASAEKENIWQQDMKPKLLHRICMEQNT